MRLILLFCSLLTTFIVISGSVSKGQSVNEGEALFLTKYIENGDIKTARKLAFVAHPEIAIQSYSGYFTVNKEYNSNLFFYFVPAANNPREAPVLLYLEGGPGAPTMTDVFCTTGPYNVNSSGELVPNEYSWHLDHNVIFIDNPVGTGFSFTDSDDGYATNEEDVSRDLLSALQQFFVMFPKLQKNEFFVYGISYGGKYAPAIGYAIHQENNRKNSDSEKPKIKLKGIGIANGLTDPIHQMNYADYLYQIGLIDSNGHKLFEEMQNKAIECIKNSDFGCADDITQRLVVGSNVQNGTIFSNLTGLTNIYNFVTEPYNYSLADTFLQKLDFRRAFHVGNNSFQESLKVQEFLRLDLMNSVADWVSELLSHYRIMFFNGQLDIIIAYPLTENFLKNLKFSGAEEYKTAERHIWRVDNEVGGYSKQAGNLTEVLVRNAGHVASMDQPKWILDLLLRFTQHRGFN